MYLTTECSSLGGLWRTSVSVVGRHMLQIYSSQVKLPVNRTFHVSYFKSSLCQKGASYLSYLCRDGSSGWVDLVPRLLFIWLQGIERWSCLSSDYLMLSFGVSPPRFFVLTPNLGHQTSTLSTNRWKEGQFSITCRHTLLHSCSPPSFKK